MSWLTQMMPQTILPKLTLTYSDNNDRMDKCRRRLNSSIGLHMVRHGGYYIKYPEIKADRRFLKTNGVHLTQIGNQVFLNILQGAIEQFVKSKVFLSQIDIEINKTNEFYTVWYSQILLPVCTNVIPWTLFLMYIETKASVFLPRYILYLCFLIVHYHVVVGTAQTAQGWRLTN